MPIACAFMSLKGFAFSLEPDLAALTAHDFVLESTGKAP